jgi:2-C-methyl-D-erythritol 4-phosphate cytidylyltransferase
MNCAILLAGGSGRRMQGTVPDKILAPLAGRPVIEYSLEAFVRTGLFEIICIVHRDSEQKEAFSAITAKYEDETLRFVWAPGGKERQVSVFNGLAALPEQTDIVHIHDCARPMVTVEAILRVHAAADKDGAAVLAHRVTDTIKRTPCADRTESIQLEDLERVRLWASETPQSFRYANLHEAYRKVQRQNIRITDDIAAVAALGHPATLVENTGPNPKITTAADLNYIEWLLRK